MACSKVIWEESGGFDSLFLPYDFEDVDISTRWIEMGYNIKAISRSYVSHIGGATIGGIDPNRYKHTEMQRLKYIAKWEDRFPQLVEQLRDMDGKR